MKTSLAAAISIIETGARRIDGWINSQTGFGTSTDRTAYGYYAASPDIPDEELAQMYKGGGISRRIVSIVPSQIYRNGIKIQAQNSEPIEAAARRLGLVAKLKEGMIWGRLFGGGVVVFGADDGQASDVPIDINRIQSFNWIEVFDKRDVAIHSYYADKNHPKFGKPAVYRITKRYGQQSYVHETRCVRFGGVHTARRDLDARHGWDHSVLQAIYDTIRQFDSVYTSIEHVILDASQGVLAMKGLIQAISKGGLDTIRQRAHLFDLTRNVSKTIMVDADGESYARIQAQVTGAGDALDRFAVKLSAVTGIPVTVLMGVSPAGLNATGESDLENWYNELETERVDLLQDINYALLLIARSLRIDEIPVASFPPLWQESAEKKSAREKTEAETMKIWIDSGVLTPEEVTKMIFEGDPRVQWDLRPLPSPQEAPAAEEEITPDASAPKRLVDESAALFAERMTALQRDRCEHGRVNGCKFCGITRERGIDDAGNFVIRWKAIQT